jgi:polyisoprenoid-binding protein YceI
MFNLNSKGIEVMLKKTFAALALGTALFTAGQAMAADYKIDKEGQHAFIDWKVSHLGYSFIHGTFKDWDGTFSWDSAKPQDSKISVDVKTASLWSNHWRQDCRRDRRPDLPRRDQASDLQGHLQR